MPITIEYVINNFYKVVYVCSNSIATVVGDLPVLPWCFECSEELSVEGSKVCWSNYINVRVGSNEYRVRVKGAYLNNSLHSVMFIAYRVPCSLDPNMLFSSITSSIREVCNGNTT